MSALWTLLREGWVEYRTLSLISAAPPPSPPPVIGPSTCDQKIHRGYYTVARRYEFYFRVAKHYFTNERSE